MNSTAEVSQRPEATPNPIPLTRYVLRAVAGLVLVAGLLWLVLPRVTGAALSDVRAILVTVDARTMVGLTVLWAAGLVTYSFVLTGSLPGLSRRRALTLNLTGSAVANVLPFGGAVGMSLNYVMVRAWRQSPTEFAAFTLVSNLWGVMLKLALPAVALGVLVGSGSHASSLLRGVALTASVLLALAVGVLVVALARRSAALRTADLVRRLVDATIGRRGRFSGERIAGHLLGLRDQVAHVVGRHWLQLTVAMAGYALLQAALLWACIHAVGGAIAPAVLLAGYAADRVLTLAVFTPGGAGVAEAGTAGLLVALGGDPATTAAAVLLYRGFTFALEIPVGGLWLGGWLLARRRARRHEPVPVE